MLPSPRATPPPTPLRRAARLRRPRPCSRRRSRHQSYIRQFHRPRWYRRNRLPSARRRAEVAATPGSISSANHACAPSAKRPLLRNPQPLAAFRLEAVACCLCPTKPRTYRSWRLGVVFRITSRGTSGSLQAQAAIHGPRSIHSCRRCSIDFFKTRSCGSRWPKKLPPQKSRATRTCYERREQAKHASGYRCPRITQVFNTEGRSVWTTGTTATRSTASYSPVSSRTMGNGCGSATAPSSQCGWAPSAF
mmetsp:Transcript_38645/g.106444  ORF Transcript_38645/g.106444 Transcript_38645/m.106444 type:complete len:249 (+) Transcript_38645:1068-1814(+)